ncbi:TPA: HEAT repeat domain-containing protein [Pseudomonas aeruginosa]|uniref:HEAT repeat domain-containing protein n=1 Tax=Pseudomonas aeruginosa TaxID=287 RepID=UPI001322B837|nr:hypothetical protein [Pseudomonas aeruginosa]MWV82283.1 hypothetical protein [Pseudomonas aeruginosa]MWW12396.1 hypothetical protein [Pseudomonas aeruginosa]HEJ4808993.1 HEAT repeat domain-containing protein [Pseudomonas aeruginosa]
MFDQIISDLIDALENAPHVEARLGAARGLGEAGGDRAINALRTALKEAPRAEVRGAAAHALGRIAGNLEH